MEVMSFNLVLSEHVKFSCSDVMFSHAASWKFCKRSDPMLMLVGLKNSSHLSNSHINGIVALWGSRYLRLDLSSRNIVKFSTQSARAIVNIYLQDPCCSGTEGAEQGGVAFQSGDPGGAELIFVQVQQWRRAPCMDVRRF